MFARPSRVLSRPLAAATMLALALSSSAAFAETYTHYTERYLNSSEYVNYSPDYAPSNYGTVRDTTGAATEYGWSGQRTWPFGSGVSRNVQSDVYALADLATGELKARSVVTIGNNPPGGTLMPPGGVSAQASASATFADTISFANGAGRPYLWSQGEQFTFNFAIDGQIDLPAGHAAPTSYLGLTYAAVRLNVYRAGQGFSAIQAFQDFAQTMDWGNDADVAHFYDLNDAINVATLTSQYWLVGDSLVSPSWYTDPGVQFVSLDDTGAAQLQFSFAADGDFEFVLSLETTASVDLAYQGLTSRVDFSHTLKTSFVAPEGATVSSASGLLPGTVGNVPEPEGYALLIGGLSVLAWTQRRRQRASR